MTASIALNNALSGLNVNQQALTVLSQNIANANTPGYSKQTLNQTALSLDGQGEGVSVESITRKVDSYLAASAQLQNSSVGQTSVVNDYYSKIQLLLGSPDDNDSIDSYVNSFFNSVQALSQTPDNTTLQQQVVSTGVTAATQFNQLEQGLNGLQFQADQDINTAVQNINTDLSNIYQLNKTITQQTALGQSVADLQDQRDGYVTDIAKYMNVSSVQNSNGQLFLTTTNGTNLLNNNLYKLNYTPATSAITFSNNAAVGALTLTPLDSTGAAAGLPVTIVSGGTASQATTILTSGSIVALTNIRDQIIPNITNQLDSIASTLRNQVNTVNNAGSGYPGANSFTGTTSVNAGQNNAWSGNATIAIVGSNGEPIPSPYTDEGYGMQPLTLNLAALNTGNGAGSPTVQGIINAINQYYGPQQNKAELGNMNNIQLISNNTSLPNATNTLSLGFNLNNISATTSNFFVSNVTVADNNGNSLPASSTIPTIALNPLSTYTTGVSNANVIIGATDTSKLTNGEVVYLSTPPAGPDSGSYGGISPASLGGYFTISNVTSSGFQITTDTAATTTVTEGATNQTATPPYASVPSGGTVNSSSNGAINVDLSTRPNAIYYTVTATVGVDDGSGNVKTSQITYQIYNNQPAIKNSVFGAQKATTPGTIVSPTSTRPIAVAKLVDANGVELPKINGQYVTNVNGYLEIQATDPATSVAIASNNSKELGQPESNPPLPASNRGFSYYFGLNNFFEPGTQIPGGEAVTGSALNLTVEQRIQNNNGLLSLGQLVQGSSSVAANAPPNYTYQLNPGDGSIALQMAGIASQEIDFPASGGLGQTTETLSGYVAQVIGGLATNASTATTDNTNASALLDSYNQQSSAISGVNLDTELANTVIYQNAYAASARVVTVTSSLFDSLLQAFQ